MNAPLTVPVGSRTIVYPDSDGKPMADNTKQLDWMTLLYGNLRIHFRDRAHDVFVGANQLWYPVEGEPETRVAPDVYVVFGRPQGHRGPYKQWEEGGLPITVTFEIRSPSNDYPDLIETLDFYEEYGVEEYILYDPATNFFQVHQRQGKANLLRPVRLPSAAYTSERLGIRFDTSGEELVVYFPDGRRFLTHAELESERFLAAERAERAAQETERERQRAERAAQETERERQRAERAVQEVERERQRAERLMAIADRLARGAATPEDLAELQRLREPPAT